mmetsp:Transcript_7177/g.14945  ORF Transcript_7177/g.14945 Transcript_7177/m.14945 type:complete len:565 (+) Transcript_7177:155-1849(+)
MSAMPANMNMQDMIRSPTFFVGANRQKQNLAEFQRREQQLAEAYHKNKALCFNARCYQKTHPMKAQKGHKDADATLGNPMILGVADGVSQIEDFGIDASLLPKELLKVCEELAIHQLIPGTVPGKDTYRGPIPLLRRAFEATESLGSLTCVLAIMDNSTRIHGKLHPMVAIITIGDCELLILRRTQGSMGQLQAVCHTEMQRIDGHAQTPLQLARVDARIDPDFYEGITIEVIEKGSAVHCLSAYEGDIVVMGSDGVFDNLFLDEITDLANSVLQPGQPVPTHEPLLGHLAQCIVKACHAKTRPGPNGQMPEAPIGRGGKKDDTSCVVAEVVLWSQAHAQVWLPRRRSSWQNLFSGLPAFDNCCSANYDSDEEFDTGALGADAAPVPPWVYDADPRRHSSASPPWAQLGEAAAAPAPGTPWGPYPTGPGGAGGPGPFSQEATSVAPGTTWGPCQVDSGCATGGAGSAGPWAVANPYASQPPAAAFGGSVCRTGAPEMRAPSAPGLPWGSYPAGPAGPGLDGSARGPWAQGPGAVAGYGPPLGSAAAQGHWAPAPAIPWGPTMHR